MLLLLESFDSFLELEEPRSGRWRSLLEPSRMHRCKLQAAWLHGCTRETRKIAKWPMVGDGPLGAPLKSTSTGPRLACDRIRLCLMFVTWGYTPYIAIPKTMPHTTAPAHPACYGSGSLTQAHTCYGGSFLSQTLAACCRCSGRCTVVVGVDYPGPPSPLLLTTHTAAPSSCVAFPVSLQPLCSILPLPAPAPAPPLALFIHKRPKRQDCTSPFGPPPPLPPAPPALRSSFPVQSAHQTNSAKIALFPIH